MLTAAEADKLHKQGRPVVVHSQKYGKHLAVILARDAQRLHLLTTGQIRSVGLGMMKLQQVQREQVRDLLLRFPPPGIRMKTTLYNVSSGGDDWGQNCFQVLQFLAEQHQASDGLRFQSAALRYREAAKTIAKACSGKNPEGVLMWLPSGMIKAGMYPVTGHFPDSWIAAAGYRKPSRTSLVSVPMEAAKAIYRSEEYQALFVPRFNPLKDTGKLRNSISHTVLLEGAVREAKRRVSAALKD